MKRYLRIAQLAFVALAFSGTLRAQLANDDCFGAQNLGTLGVPAACPSGLGAVMTVNNLTNINSVTETPYTTLINCQPTNVTPMASPATDVWYQVTVTGNELHITINGGIATPNIAVYQGTCNGLIGRGCAIGSGNSLTAVFDQMVPGNTYYIQVSGGTPADQGNFTMTLQSVNNCSLCLTQSNLTVNPLPTNGGYAGGTTVTFCYTITNWQQQNTNWLHAVIPTFGSGWNMSTLTNLSPAATCDGGPGVWQWFNNVNCPNGNGIQTGFFFDGDIVQGGPNGNPTDNFGDNCNGNVNWQFCWTITSNTCPPGGNGDDLGIDIDTYGDGETGNWTNIACVGDPIYQFNAQLICCAPPQLVHINVTCNGGTDGSATATPVGVGPFDYSWTGPNGYTSTSTNQNGANTINNLAAGTYNVSVTDQSNGCVTVASVTITEPTAMQLLVGSTPASCGQSNGSATATPQGGTGPYDFVWTDANNVVIQTANNVNGANSATNLAQGSYNVVVTDNNGCTSNVTINVAGAPGNVSAQVVTSNCSCFGICDGSLTASGSGGTAPYGYSWNTVPVQNTPTASNLCPGNYICTVTDATGCSTTVNGTITQPAQVTLNATANPTTICIGQQATLTATGGGGDGGPYTYNWAAPLNATGSPQNVSPAVTTVYSVTASDGANCPSSAVTVTVTVNPALTAQLVANPTTVCEGQPVTLTATGGGGNGGPYTYTWNPAVAGNTNTTSVIPTTTTVYTVTIDDGCTTPTAQATVTVTVNPLPTVQFSGAPLQGCAPLVTTFTNQTAGSTNCLWDFGNGTSTNCGPNVTNTYTVPGCYDVTLTVTDANGCVNTLTMPQYACAFPVVDAQFSANPQPTNIFNTQITFTDMSTGAPNSWNWDFGQQGTSTQQNPQFTFPSDAPGCYDVVLVANNAFNCPDQDTMQVCIDPEFTIYFPNAFTPNGDGLNDGFIGVGEGIKKYEMWIFDRWGNLIYVTDDMYHPWDGKVQGGSDKICQEDVYVWKVRVVDVFDKQHKYIGHVTLLQ